MTRQASYSLIEDMRNFSRSLLCHGEIEEKEYENIEKALVKSRKHLLFHPPKLRMRSEADVLKDMDAFKSLPTSGLHMLQRKAKEMVLQKGHVIYKAGDKPTGFYIIIRGTVQMSIQSMTSHSMPVVIDRLGAGSIFGILGFMTESPRHTSIICDSYVQAYFVDRHVFAALQHLDGAKEMNHALWQCAGKNCAVRFDPA